jgi:hypothetical protein
MGETHPLKVEASYMWIWGLKMVDLWFLGPFLVPENMIKYG